MTLESSGKTTNISFAETAARRKREDDNDDEVVSNLWKNSLALCWRRRVERGGENAMLLKSNLDIVSRQKKKSVGSSMMIILMLLLCVE